MPALQAMIVALHHVNVTVPPDLEAATKHFYREVLGLKQIPKPSTSRQTGAWYELGASQLHLSVEEQPETQLSSRHFCVTVSDLAEAEQKFQESGIAIIPDPRPHAGSMRFFVRDPAGNQLEIAQASG